MSTTSATRATSTSARTTVASTTSSAVTSRTSSAVTSNTSSAVTSRTSSAVTSNTSSAVASSISSAVTSSTTSAVISTTSVAVSTSTTSTSTTSYPVLPQVVPNVSSNSSSSSSSSSSSTIPLFAIVILGVVGGLIALFLGHRLWSGSWRLIPRRNKDDLLPPPRTGLLDPLSEKDFKSPPFTPGSNWRRSSYGFSNREGSNSVLMKDDGSFGYNEKRASGNGAFFDTEKNLNGSDLMLPPKIAAYYAAGDSGSESGRSSNASSPAVGEFGLPDSPMVNQVHSTLASDATRGDSIGDGRGHMSRPSSSSSVSSPLSPVPRPIKTTNLNRNSFNSLNSATYPQRRSLYAMSLYSTPHHDPQLLPVPNSHNRPSSGYFAPNPNNRVIGAPHSRNSKIELSIPQPLGPPPGAVTATDKSTLGFTNLSGIQTDKNGSIDQQNESNWLKEVIDDSKNRVDKEVEEVLRERERKKSGMSWGSRSLSGESRAGREGWSESESRERSTSRPNNSTLHERTASSTSFASTNANFQTNAHTGSRSAQLSSIGDPFGSSSNPQSSGDSTGNSGRTSIEMNDGGRFERSPLDNLKREMKDRSSSGSGNVIETVIDGRPSLKLSGRLEARQGTSLEPKEPSVEGPTMIIPAPESIEQASDQNDSDIKMDASVLRLEEVQPKPKIPSNTDGPVVENS